MTGADDDYVRRERLLLLHHGGDRYLVPPAPGERYLPPPDRYLPPPAPAPADHWAPASPPAPAPNERYVPPLSPSGYDRYDRYDRYQDRYYDRYISPQSPNYHERYICGTLDRYDRFQNVNVNVNVTPGGPGDPYMRRDLGYHHHYRLPPPPGFYHPVYQRTLPNHSHHNAGYATMRHHRHTRCCPGMYPQGNVREGNSGGGSARDYVTSPVLPRGRTCRSGSSGSSSGSTPVEYVGSSGGRYVSTTPPLPRCASVSDVKDQCGTARRGCDTMTLCCSSRRPPPPPPQTGQLLTPHHNSVWRAVGQSPPSPTPPPTTDPPSLPTLTTPSTSPSAQMEPTPHPFLRSVSAPSAPLPVPSDTPSPSPGATCAPDPEEAAEAAEQVAPLQQPPLSLRLQPPARRRPLLHQASAPVTQAEMRRVHLTRTELVKDFIKREAAVFLGVDKETEARERARWQERRKRLCTRKYGLKPEHCQTPRIAADASDGGREEGDEAPRWTEPPVRRKPSVAKMTFKGMALVVQTLGRHRSTRASQLSRQMSRSYSPSTVPATPDPSSPLEDEVFYDQPSLTEPSATPAVTGDSVTDSPHVTADRFTPAVVPEEVLPQQRLNRLSSWKRQDKQQDSVAVGQVGLSRIYSHHLDGVLDNSDRRQYGMGIVGRLFGRSLKRSVTNREPVKEQLEDLEDHRPFFTYWVTTVQILILFFSLFCYGFGPIGIDLHQESGLVLVTSLSLQQVEFSEPANFWIGPRAADLIHLGAKFAPCMRKDAKIIKEIEKGREKERETACCIRNDDSGCVQSSQADCSITHHGDLIQHLRPTKTISTWKKWSPGDSGPGGRISGTVCGLDPKFCEAPASVAPYEWPDDITKWPICRKTFTGSERQLQRERQKDRLTAEHMVCEVIGHPCCIGIHGSCRITTREYCDFVHGYFHEEASLCSQVSCLDNVCGMIPFYSPEVPDQFYRLWTSLFLHAGIIHLAITLVLQWFMMRDLEKLTGSLRIMIIYMGSGVGGNLASAIFVPYRADVGPAGAQFGLLACLIVEVLNSWQMLKYPHQALLKLVSIVIFLFVFGLLPWVDNFAHLFGFIFGFLLSFALLPFVSFGEYDRQKKIFLIWVCLMTCVFLFLTLLLLFYVTPLYDCQICSYFNCLPLTDHFCSAQNINFKREVEV